MSAGRPVEAAIVERIAANGPIPFAEFMDLALYGEHGYYAVDEPRIGAAGDFVTGSRSRLFAATTHRLLAQIDRNLAAPAQLLEVGYGDGQHLRHLSEMGRDHLSAHDRVRRPLPPGVAWMERLDRAAIRGVVFSYELFDALPVHRLVARDGALQELYVGRASGENSGFDWVEGVLSDPDVASLVGDAELVEGQIFDVTPSWPELYGQLANTLSEGLLLTFDYGYRRQQLFDPRVRLHGTLACYRRHTVHRDPFVDVGRQDLTAHVDFTTLIKAGEAVGLRTLGLFKLAEWLTALGMFDDLQNADRTTMEQAQCLLDPSGMGSEIKVLVQARGDDATYDLLARP